MGGLPIQPRILIVRLECPRPEIGGDYVLIVQAPLQRSPQKSVSRRMGVKCVLDPHNSAFDVGYERECAAVACRCADRAQRHPAVRDLIALRLERTDSGAQFTCRRSGGGRYGTRRVRRSLRWWCLGPGQFNDAHREAGHGEGANSGDRYRYTSLDVVRDFAMCPAWQRTLPNYHR